MLDLQDYIRQLVETKHEMVPLPWWLAARAVSRQREPVVGIGGPGLNQQRGGLSTGAGENGVLLGGRVGMELGGRFPVLKWLAAESETAEVLRAVARNRPQPGLQQK